MINIPWGNDFALKLPIKKKVIQTTGEIEIQNFDVSSVEQLHVFLQHNEHLPDWHSSQVEWSADPENSSGIIVEVSSQMAPIGMYNIILTGVQNGRRFFSQQCRQFKIIGNASSSDLVIYEGIQTYTLDEVIVLDARGRDGLSAYELAVARGFEGTESEWMATLKGENGNGVAGVELIEQVGNVDHYRMTFTDGTYFDYTVTNSSGNLTPEQIAEIVTELSNTISAGDLNAYTKPEVNALLNNKQDTIQDLSTIRNGASAGATAYQKPSTGIPLNDLSQDVKDAIENAGTLTEESDPIFTASPAHGITSTDITNWNGKYTKSNSGIPKTDLANDVQTSLGKADTALQSYTESDPTVPSHVKAITTTDISNWNSKQNSLTFDSTPTAGSNNPVTSAGIKAYVDNATPTITMDDTPTSGSSNPVKSSGIYNALQGKQNTLTFDSTPTASSSNPVTSGGVKTALDLKANQSTTYTKTEVDALIGAGTSNFSGSYNDLTNKPTIPTTLSQLTGDSTHRVVSDTEKSSWDGKAEPTPVVNHGTSDTTFALTPNVLHIWGEVTALTLTLATPADATIVNEYMFQFTSGATATTLSLPSTVVWDNEKGEISIESGYIYQVSILNNIALWARVAV